VLGSESAATGGLPSGPISATGLPAVQACKTRPNEKIGPISGILRLFPPETTDFQPISVPIPANWPVGRCGGFGPFWISHDQDIRAS